MRDSRNVLIQLGDKITYPVRRGSKLCIEEGTVRVIVSPLYGMDYSEDWHLVVEKYGGKKVKIRNYENVTVAERAKPEPRGFLARLLSRLA